MTYNKLMAGVIYETIKINSSTQISSTLYNHVGARHQALDARSLKEDGTKQEGTPASGRVWRRAERLPR